MTRTLMWMLIASGLLAAPAVFAQEAPKPEGEKPEVRQEAPQPEAPKPEGQEERA